MKLKLSSLFIGCCVLFSSADSSIFDTLPTLPTLPVGTITDEVVDEIVDEICTIFGTSLTQIQSSVTLPVDGLVTNVLNTLDVTLGATSAYQQILTKAAQAKAPPLNFPCTDSSQFKSDSPPLDINHVRIGDIKCTALMGDSVAAGLGTNGNNIVSASLEPYPGYESKAGGIGSVSAGNTTIPNIMRDLFQNSGLQGQASEPVVCYPPGTCAGLDVADIWAFHPDYVFQAIELVKRILTGSYCEYNDYKIIHVFYGVNDMCLLCNTFHYDDSAVGLTMMRLHLRIAMAILKVFLPNSMVYLHIPYDLTPLYDLSTNLGCSVVQRILCPCVSTNPLLHLDGSSVRKNQQIIANELHKICMEFNGDNNFHCSEIKHLNNTKPPAGQPEILGANCVHPSRAAHYIHARYTLNEMFTHPDQRHQSEDYSVNTNNPITLLCPNATYPYLRTYFN